MNRAYTLKEVERIRAAIKTMRDAPMIMSGSLSIPKNEKQEIEEEIRTYMAAGVSAEDIERKAQEMCELYWQHRQAMDERHRNTEAVIFRAHDIVKTEWQNKPRPKSEWKGSRDCEGCRYFSPAMAGAYWNRCEHPSIKTKVTDHGWEKSYERPRCQEMRGLFSECGKSGRLFEPADISADEALWMLAQLSPDAVRRLAFRGHYLGSEISGLTKESEDELEALGIDYTSRMNRVLIKHLMRAHSARISGNTSETQTEPDAGAGDVGPSDGP